MDRRLVQLLRRQQASGFADLEGTEIAITLPISDRLLNEAIAEALTLPAQIREVKVRTHAGERIGVRVKLGTPSFLPPINITVVIDRQPELPGSPVLVLRLEMGGLLSLAGTALRFLEPLPPGIRVDHDRIYVDLATLAEARGLDAWLSYLEHLEIHTAERSLILTLRAAARPRAGATEP